MTTIRVSEEVKERLRELKRPDESFNDLLARLSRPEKDVEAVAETLSGLGGEELERRMDEAHEDLNGSLESRLDR